MSLIPNMPLRRLLEHGQRSSRMWPSASCPWGLDPRPPPPRAHGVPRSAMLLWQTSLGGTVRQCLCPCQGKEYPLSPPCQFLAAGSAAVQAFQGCCCKQQQQRCSPTSFFPLQTWEKTALAHTGNETWCFEKNSREQLCFYLPSVM